MPIFIESAGIRTEKATIQSGQGTLRLHFSNDRFVDVRFDKLGDSEFTLPAASGVAGYDGFELVGSSHAIYAATASSDTAALYAEGLTSLDDATTYTIDNGFGKVDLNTSGSGRDDDNTKNVKNVSALHGVALLGNEFTEEQGAVIFARATGTANAVITGGGASSAGTVNGGSGIANYYTAGTTTAVTDRFTTVGNAGDTQVVQLSSEPEGNISTFTVDGVAFTSATGTPNAGEFVFNDNTNEITFLVPAGGAGLAIVATYNAAAVGSGTLVSRLRLDESSYPFVLTGSDRVEPIGSSVIFFQG